MKNRPLSTSLRSATQATDSTRKGWMANTAATMALGHRSPVMLPQDQEQQDRRGRMEQDVGQMVSAGPETVDLAVEHVGEPGQRVPIAGMVVEGPRDPLEAQAARDLGVLVDVLIVIEVDELVPNCLGENEQDCQEQETARGPSGQRCATGSARTCLCLCPEIHWQSQWHPASFRSSRHDRGFRERAFLNL